MHFVEQWLLDRMVKVCPPLWLLLLSPEGLRAQWNAFSRDITPDRVRGGLLDLLRKGHIYGYTRRGETKESLGFTDLEALLCGSRAVPKDVYFGMTPAGGRRCERYSFIDWRRYDAWHWVDCDESDSHSQDFEGRWQIEAGSWERILALLATRASKFPAIPDVAGLEIEVLSPWEATYWKTLPRGYRCEVGFWHVYRLSSAEIEKLDHKLVEEFDRLYASFRAAEEV